MIGKWISWLFNTEKLPEKSLSHESDNHIGEKMNDDNEVRMSPTRPYILKAFYDWIVANNCTPHLVVSTDIKGVQVPQEFIQENNTIILNISPTAVREFVMNKNSVSFCASFSGQHQDLFVPIEAITSIFARENHRGMIFEEEDFSIPSYNESQERKKGFGPKLVVSNTDQDLIKDHEDN